MSHFAAAAVQRTNRWVATELDLNSAADLEDVTDRLRDVDPDALISLLFVEADDTYLAILRLDEGEDLRMFGSDAVFVDESRLGALLLGDVKEPVTLDLDAVVNSELSAEPGGESDEADPTPVVPGVEPIGDPDLLADLGISAQRLLALCGREGMLPADVTSEVCQIIGCGDEVEELREA